MPRTIVSLENIGRLLRGVGIPSTQPGLGSDRVPDSTSVQMEVVDSAVYGLYATTEVQNQARGISEAAEPPADSSLTELERAILATVLYAELFDYPLTESELFESLIGATPSREDLRAALVELVRADRLDSADGYYVAPGKRGLVAVRRRRRELSRRRFELARRFARWMTCVPFVRCVGVCGSLAIENSDEDGDIDLFVIAERGRLWIVQAATMVMRRGSLIWRERVCPNYFLGTASLRIRDRSLYTAHEVAQLVPLVGRSAYLDFVDANRWVDELLPNADFVSRADRSGSGVQPALARWLERLLGGKAGELLDRALHRVLSLYYRLRLRRHGRSRQAVSDAYSRERQEVIAGGYGPVVARRFAERVREYADAVGFELATDPFLFPQSEQTSGDIDPLYARLFGQRYGDAWTGEAAGGRDHG